MKKQIQKDLKQYTYIKKAKDLENLLIELTNYQQTLKDPDEYKHYSQNYIGKIIIKTYKTLGSKNMPIIKHNKTLVYYPSTRKIEKIIKQLNKETSTLKIKNKKGKLLQEINKYKYQREKYILAVFLSGKIDKWLDKAILITLKKIKTNRKKINKQEIKTYEKITDKIEKEIKNQTDLQIIRNTDNNLYKELKTKEKILKK